MNTLIQSIEKAEPYALIEIGKVTIPVPFLKPVMWWKEEQAIDTRYMSIASYILKQLKRRNW